MSFFSPFHHFFPFFPICTDHVVDDSELMSVSILLPPAPPDHLLSVPWGEHYPARSTCPGDDPEGLFAFKRNKNVSSLHFNDLYMLRLPLLVSAFFTRCLVAPWDRIWYWNSRRRCSLWNSLNKWAYESFLFFFLFSFFLSVTPDTNFFHPLSASSSSPACCASLQACLPLVISCLATVAWMCLSVWSSPKPHPQQTDPWLLNPTHCFSRGRSQGETQQHPLVIAFSSIKLSCRFDFTY